MVEVFFAFLGCYAWFRDDDISVLNVMKSCDFIFLSGSESALRSCNRFVCV